MRDTEFNDPDREPFQEEGPEEPGLDIWQRLSKLVLAMLFVCVVIAVLRLFLPEIERRNHLQQQALYYEELRAKKASRLAQLQKEYDLLRNDREYLEAVARDRLDLMREGETIFRLERPNDVGAGSLAPWK